MTTTNETGSLSANYNNQYPMLYANADSLRQNPPSLVVTVEPTPINKIQYLPAESTRPLQVAVLSLSATLTRLLNLWTDYSGKMEDINAVDEAAYEKLNAEFSTLRTAYLKAKTKGRQG